MIPIGDKPILWHLIRYYSQFGHKDFVLCLGYKANVVKEFSLNYRPQVYAGCVVSGFGDNVEILGDPQQDWRIAMIDTGIWRNIGQRLWAVREHVAGEEMFFANYSDGLCDLNLDEMTADFRASGKVGCFLAVPAVIQSASRRHAAGRKGPASGGVQGRFLPLPGRRDQDLVRGAAQAYIARCHPVPLARHSCIVPPQQDPAPDRGNLCRSQLQELSRRAKGNKVGP
jgi:NDP-sugar pyrophosphorylase family protein